MATYGKVEYWEERYTREPEPFDWYQRWTGLKDLFVQYLEPSNQILHVGCGNSKLAEDMYEDGFLNSINIDISHTVIKAMQEKYTAKTTMRYLQMDAKKLSFEDNSVDAIIDKGTLDSVLCGENSTAFAQKVISEAYRVLAPHGTYFIVTYGQPPQRYPYLDRPEFNWEITVHQVPRPSIPTNPVPASEDRDQPNVHYIYACRKRSSEFKGNEVEIRYG